MVLIGIFGIVRWQIVSTVDISICCTFLIMWTRLIGREVLIVFEWCMSHSTLSDIMPNRKWVSLRIISVGLWPSWWTAWCLQMVNYLWCKCTHAWSYGWSNIYYSGCEFLLKDINHLHYLMFLNFMPTIQKVGVLALIHGEWINLTQVLYHPQNVNFVWNLDHIHLLMIITGFGYIRLWVGMFLNLITMVYSLTMTLNRLM